MMKVLLLLVFVAVSAGFIWRLDEELPQKVVLTFSEKNMFANRNGPLMLEQGHSFIKVASDVSVLFTSKRNKSSTVAVAIYRVDEEVYRKEPLNGMCSSFYNNAPSWARDLHLRSYPTHFVKSLDIPGLELGDHSAGGNAAKRNITNLWKTHLNISYTVQTMGWYNVAFELCEDNVESVLSSKLFGLVTFRNPHGYIPAELYGLLPFEGARMIAYFLFGLFFVYRYFRYKESTLPVHLAVLVVFVVALTEATTWYAAYQSINLSGTPYCCPFPAVVVASLILQIFRQTFARCLLLVVSLGYGIVRPKLLPMEWIAIVVVTAAYFIAATVSQVSDIILVNDVHSNSEGVYSYQVPELFMDVLFLSWIYLALGATLRILKEFQQSYKLSMYRTLGATIAIFVGLFVMVTILVMLDKMKFIDWPWQFTWVQQVMWESLNFAALTAACFICLPSENSQLLSYATQLPTEDPDDDLDEGNHGFKTVESDESDNSDERDIESSQPPRRFTSTFRSSTGKSEIEMRSGGVSRGVAVKKTPSTGQEGFSSLPPAQEDDDFGLDD